jgi:hypothetical protein
MLIIYSLWHCTQRRKCCRGILGLFGVPDSFCSVGEMHTRYVAEVTGNVEADFRFFAINLKDTLDHTSYNL